MSKRDKQWIWKNNLSKVFQFFFMPQLLKQDKGRALIKTTCQICSSSQRVPLKPSGSEGRGVQPPQGDSFLPYLFSTSLTFFRTIFSFYLFKPSHVSVNKPFEKGHQTCLIVKYIYLGLYCSCNLCFVLFF